MSDASNRTGNGTSEMKLEIIVVPVSDDDRAKAFYGGLGWRLDAELFLMMAEQTGRPLPQ
jgi:catechol 2,3-dioxygenase-like lactoylglutathione lyase family enzyme